MDVINSNLFILTILISGEQLCFVAVCFSLCICVCVCDQFVQKQREKKVTVKEIQSSHEVKLLKLSFEAWKVNNH